MRIFVYDRNDEDAESAVRKLSAKPLKSNMFIPVTEAEFAALRDSFITIEVDDPPRKSLTPTGEAGNDTGNTKENSGEAV